MGSPISAISDQIFEQLFDTSDVTIKGIRLSIDIVQRQIHRLFVKLKPRSIEFQVIENGILLGTDLFKKTEIDLVGMQTLLFVESFNEILRQHQTVKKAPLNMQK